MDGFLRVEWREEKERCPLKNIPEEVKLRTIFISSIFFSCKDTLLGFWRFVKKRRKEGRYKLFIIFLVCSKKKLFHFCSSIGLSFVGFVVVFKQTGIMLICLDCVQTNILPNWRKTRTKEIHLLSFFLYPEHLIRWTCTLFLLIAKIKGISKPSFSPRRWKYIGW